MRRSKQVLKQEKCVFKVESAQLHKETAPIVVGYQRVKAFGLALVYQQTTKCFKPLGDVGLKKFIDTVSVL
jgi:hypothetical protein